VTTTTKWLADRVLFHLRDCAPELFIAGDEMAIPSSSPRHVILARKPSHKSAIGGKASGTPAIRSRLITQFAPEPETRKHRDTERSSREESDGQVVSDSADAAWRRVYDGSGPGGG
jgi:hypothetical protein